MSRHWRPLSAVCLVLGALVCWLRFSYSENDLPAISFGHKPDYSRYVPHRVLTKAELGLENPRRRLIAVGDIHGMNESFHKLLRGVRYDPKYDILITLGDMLTKSTTPGSLSLLAFLADHNVTAVRGNHDQVVVSWRAWQDSVSAFPGGELWLARLDARFAATKKGRRKWVAEERRKGEKKWWDKVPKGWVRDMMGEHYQIARAMSPTEAAYLRSLPTLVHAPSLHTFFVHAGLLASDPRLPTTAATQPLARPPPHTAPPPKRAAQEAKILTQVSQNADPWTHMHLRTITSDGELSRLLDDDDDDDDDDDGEDDGDALKNGRIFWAKVWVKTMNRCKGFDPTATSADEQEYEGEGEYAIEYTPSKQMRIDLRAKKSFNDDRSPLPCMPASVVYGHTASRGLDVRRWSVGLDSGCAYGRALSALVIDRHALKSNEDAPAEGEVELDGVRWRQIKFGDNGYASVASVPCKVEALD